MSGKPLYEDSIVSDIGLDGLVKRFSMGGKGVFRCCPRLLCFEPVKEKVLNSAGFGVWYRDYEFFSNGCGQSTRSDDVRRRHVLFRPLHRDEVRRMIDARPSLIDGVFTSEFYAW